MMLEKIRDNAEIINLAVEILLRQAVTTERGDAALNLAYQAKFAINWRTVTASEVQLGLLWDTLSRTIDMDQLSSCTDELVFRLYDFPAIGSADSISDPPLLRSIARSLAWPAMSLSLPAEQIKFTAKESDYLTSFKKNPWAIFLYLIYASDAVTRLGVLFPKSTPTKPRRSDDETASAS